MKKKAIVRSGLATWSVWHSTAIAAVLVFVATAILVAAHTPLFGMHSVRGASSTAKPLVRDPKDISNTPAGQIATREKLLAMMKPGDPSTIFSVVDAIQADPMLSINCHELAHDLGHHAYKLYGFSGAMNFSDSARLSHASVQDICAGGYVHGILEEASIDQPSFTTHPGALCETVTLAQQASCYHGVGHALMFTYFREVDASLAGCRLVEHGSEVMRCFEGVWMELFWGNTNYAGPNSLGWDTTKPLAPCIATQKDAKPGCFLYSAFGYLRTHPKDYAGAITLCTKSRLVLDDSDFCVKGVGITMMSRYKGHHLEQAESTVDGLNFYQKYAFYQGMIGYARLDGIGVSELGDSCKALKNDTKICQSALAENP